MPSFVPLQSSNPNHRAYIPPNTFPIARNQALAAIGRAELPRAGHAFPLGFQRTPDGPVLVALMGLGPENNLFLTHDARWAGAYVPATYRAWPFALGTTQDNRTVVCIDETAGVPAETAGARALFDAADQPTAFLQELMTFLSQSRNDLVATRAACAALDSHGLLVDWPITINAGETQRPIEGLLKVDEAALNGAGADVLDALNKAGALAVAYGQLLSMTNLSILAKLAEAHARAAEKLQERAKDASEMFAFDDEVQFNFD
ncbi:SapC family protein [Roseospira marina]|uniref:SapC family protein n=1 Tax=Roseospira marina TaxID=140057 RepID=A0A5M6IEV0_9PROT|nr:SapC family protein [Roseospira marina]KAA5606088.1 SapC family protein [Roseospira marina]MBB4313046.1 hypothetical protein [Roseospira marina]MBB5086213.1 hypothetical protein [Roseospira marina]